MLPMMTCDDLFNINANIVKKFVEAVADNCPKALIHIISNSMNSTVSFVVKENNLKPINVDVPIQNAGTEVVEEKGGVGSATLSMVYAAARFIESSLRALDGDGDIYEYSYVESDLIELTFFASRVKLGRNGVEALVTYMTSKV
ncbi:PREDICTED: malate dehydrogenase [Prunus dulcis]|uniref:malate dehydrogenase n=1 Tax=Prunus dulcis TaxID=3755 RepID=A0A5E4FE48_PRUDU|nr:PREDICTED: malate dehydrogenase [Prunus dulcis]